MDPTDSFPLIKSNPMFRFKSKIVSKSPPHQVKRDMQSNLKPLRLASAQLERSHLKTINPTRIFLRDMNQATAPLIRLRSAFIVANPTSLPSLFTPSGEGGGIFVGLNHPIFGLPGPQLRVWGGDGWLPPMGVPPRTRFDPVGLSPTFPGSSLEHFPWHYRPDGDEFMPPVSGPSTRSLAV